MVFIDKFYRVYSPYNTKHQATERSATSSDKTTLNLNDNNWDALNYKISNVEGGNQPNDVSTVAQTLTRKNNVFVQGKQKFNLMEVENNNWNAKKRKISNLSEASQPNDAVVLKQTLVRKDDSSFVQGDNKYNFLELKDDKYWDAADQFIENVKPGVSATQAATVGQIPIETTNWWDFKGKPISNVAEGVNHCDGAIMSQVISLDDKNKFNAKGRKITNVCPGEESGDVAITDQLIKKVGIGKFTLDGKMISLIQKDDTYNTWDGRRKKISNVIAGEYDSDVATVGQLFKRVGGNVVSNNGEQFSILQLNDNVWDCKNIRIAQIQEGVDDNDACVMKQLKNLKNIFPKLLVADPEVGLRTLDGRVYKLH